MINRFLKFSLFFICITYSLCSKAQLFDTIASSLKCKPKFYFKLDTRNSFISARKASVSGIKIGLEYKETLIIGIGLNQLKTEIYQNKIITDNPLFPDTFSMKLYYSYVSPFIEYVFFRNKKWEHAIPIQIGFGNSRFEYKNKRGETIREHNKPIVLYEPAMTTQYKIFPWLAIGGGIGYRILLINNGTLNEKFNSPVYVVKLNILWGELYRKVFKKIPMDK